MNMLHLKIVINSAQVFKTPAFFSKMCLYAVAAVETVSYSTMVDMHGGAQPRWWFPMNFQIDKSKFQNTDTELLLCIKRRKSKLCFNKTDVGKIRIPVKLLLDDYRLNSPGNWPRHVAFSVLSRSGKPRGVIYLSYLFDGEEMNTSLGGLQPPPPPRVVPSAPPLPEDETNGWVCKLLPTAPIPSAPIPSAPYLPWDNN